MIFKVKFFAKPKLLFIESLNEYDKKWEKSNFSCASSFNDLKVKLL